ncbi:MAG: hypothetical protein IJX39_07980 [Clostridia bacterium]|nr:hypothetical protein [Clostridia bacterium]
MKKLLALLLATMMVVVLVPATVLSAMTSETTSGTVGGGDVSSVIGGGTSGGGVYSPDIGGGSESIELPDGVEEGTKIEVTGPVNTVIVDDLALAVSLVPEGGTVTLLEDITLSSPVTLRGSWTLDGNGKTLTTEAGKNASPWMNVVGKSTDITIVNLSVDVKLGDIGISVSGDGTADSAAVTLIDCCVYGVSHAVACAGGFVDIYGGYYESSDHVLDIQGASDTTGSTVTVYGGAFYSNDGGSAVAVGANGHAVIVDGEFAVAGDANTVLNAVNGAGYVTILGGIFYNPGDSTSVLGYEDVTVGYYRIWGGQFYSNYYVDEPESDNAPMIENKTMSGTFTTAAGLALHYGMKIDAPYQVVTDTYTNPTRRPATTAIADVEKMGFSYCQSVVYDQDYLEANGYIAEGATWRVTNGQDPEPTYYYSFELERALYHVGNGGTLTLTKNTTVSIDSSLASRYRPNSSVITLNSSAVDGYYTMTATVSGPLMYVAGGCLRVEDLGLVNTKSSLLVLSVAGSAINFVSGYGYAKAGMMYSKVANGTIIIGEDEGSDVGPTLVSWGGNIFPNDNDASTDWKLIVYGGHITQNAGNNCIYLGKGSGTVDVYGGSFTQVGGSRMFNFSDGTYAVTFYGGNFVNTLDASDVFSLDGSTSVDLTIEGGSFTNQSTVQSVMNLETTGTPRITINGGELCAANDTDGLFCVTQCAEGTKIIINDGSLTFQGSKPMFNIGTDDACVMDLTITDGEFVASGTGAMFATGKNEKITVTGGSFSAAGGVFASGEGLNLTVTGGSFEVKGNFCSVGAKSTITMGVAGTQETADGVDAEVSNGPVVNLRSSNQIFNVSSDDGTLNVYGGKYLNWGASNVIYANKGNTALNIYDGYFYQDNSSRLIKFDGGTHPFTIHDGVFYVNIGSDIINFSSSAAQVLTIKGGSFLNDKQSVMEVSTSGDVQITIEGGTFIANNSTDPVLYLTQAGEGAKMTITGGTFIKPLGVTNYVIYMSAGLKGTYTINGGSFYMYNENVDACISVAGGTLTINAGYFYSKGVCVARPYGGTCSSALSDITQFTITKESDAVLNINGGLFVLDKNEIRSANAANTIEDAVIRAGGGSSYGWLNITGGTFISNSLIGERIINKVNPASVVTITGGTFLAGENQKYYFQSNGAMKGITDPEEIPVKSTDLVVTLENATYHVYTYGEEREITVKGYTEKAALRLEKVELETGKANETKNVYAGGLSFTTTMNLNELEKWFEGNISGDIVSEGAQEFGTLIVPVDYLERLGEGASFDHATLDAAGLKYLDVVATKYDANDGEDTVSYTAAITSILEENWDRAFVAVGYFKATCTIKVDTDGDNVGDTEQTVTYIYYADYDVEDAVSLQEAAYYLLADETFVAGLNDEVVEVLNAYAEGFEEPETPAPVPTPGEDNDDIGDDQT